MSPDDIAVKHLGHNGCMLSGWVEYGVVTSVRRVPGFPKIQDCRIDFYGAYRGNIGRTKPYNLRYYNSSLEKLDR